MITDPIHKEQFTPQPGPRPEQTPEKKRSKKGLMIGIGSGLAGAAIAAGAVMGINAAAEAPQSQPTAEAPADPSAPEAPTDSSPETPVSPELTVEQLEIPAGLSAEELGKLVVADRFTAWRNAGAREDLNKRSAAENIAWADLLPRMAGENRDLFAEALFVPDWQLDTNLSVVAEAFSDINLNTLEGYVATEWSQDTKPENIEGYRSWYTVDSSRELSKSDSERIVEVKWSLHDNSDLNTRDPLKVTAGTYTMTFRTVDNVEKMVALNPDQIKP